jgi:hypothetical protein
MGVFLQSTEATPCGHLLNWKLTRENHSADTMFMATMVMVLPWKIIIDFQSFVKIRNFDPHFKNLYLARKWVWRAYIDLVWKLDLRATYSVLQHFWSDHLLEHSEAINKPQKTFKWPWKIKVSSTSSKFRLCLPEDVWPSNFWWMLKNASEVTLEQKKFPKQFELCANCKVSWSAK